MLLCIVKCWSDRVSAEVEGDEDVVDLAGDVAFQASDDLGFGESFLGAALGVGAASGVVAEAVEHDDVEGVVGVAVAASVESVSVGAAAAGRDRRDAAQVGERGFGGDPVGVVAGAGEELAGDLGADTAKGEQVGRDLADQLGDVVIGFADLLARAVGGVGRVDAGRSWWPVRGRRAGGRDAAGRSWR